MAGIAVLIPVLERPHRVAPLTESIRTGTRTPHRIVFCVSPHDQPTRAEVEKAGAEWMIVDGPHPGDYARKINEAYKATDEPLLFLAADDLAFHRNWDVNAMRCLKPGVGVVGTNDLGNPRVQSGEHATHSLVTREYADQGLIDGPGLLFEGYHHNFCDDELIGTAKTRSAWAFAPDSIVEHLHPFWDKGEHDGVYARGLSKFHQDQRKFARRQLLWT